ncbi:hypothetical protein J4E91_001870 [Alternaria rosae]|nr:hypothetical protein J4E91_001870 [Alternaria rosae]
MAERRVVFNVSELKKVAAKALNRPASDVNAVQKIAEGDSNRISEVTMNDGSSVLVRLPYPSTLPRRLAVASEVATLDFLCPNGIPAPRVLDYSTGENSVESFGYKKQDPQDHVHPLADYIRLVTHLVPKDATVHSPTLRHPDLSPNNILISDDRQITGFIDWQHSEVLPTFLAADIPMAFANYADEESRNFTKPKLPKNLASMADKERAEVEELYR